MVLIFLFPAKAHSQSTTQGLTPAEYVNLLLGEGIEVSNVQFQGGSDQISMLSGAEAVLGLDGGVMLSTDHAGICAGSGGSGCTNCPGLGANTDLLNVANSVPPLIGQSFSVSSVYDVAMLSFDFVASGDSIQFDYIFGSDEYLEYVNTPYNDVFAFFLSGPGVSGPFSSPLGFPNGSTNLAVVPNAVPPLPITVSSVNNAVNGSLYVNNPGQVGFCTDGFTVPLRVESAVQCGEMYHIDIAIADCSDDAFESFVLIEEGSFVSEVEIEANVDATVSGCEGANVDFLFTGNLEAATWVWSFGDGTTSLEQMPTHIYTDPGVYAVLFIWEGTCELDTISLEVEIGSLEFDYEVFSPDSVNCTEENPQIVLDLGDADTGTIESIDMALSLPFTAGNQVVVDVESGVNGWNVFQVNVAQGGCQDTYVDSIYFESSAEISATLLSETLSCSGTEVGFSFSGNLGDALWVWDFGDGTSSTEESPTHVYSASGDYEVSLIWQGLCDLDTVAMSVNVPDLVFDFSVSGPNTLDCSSTDSQVVVNLGEAESATFESNTLSTSLPLVGTNSVTWDIESGSDGWNFYSITVAQADCIETYTDSVFVVSGVEVDYTLSPEVVCQGEPVTLTVFYGADVVISSPVPTNLANSPNFVPLDNGAGYGVPIKPSESRCLWISNRCDKCRV